MSSDFVVINQMVGRRIIWRIISFPFLYPYLRRLAWLFNAKFIIGVMAVIFDQEGRVLLVQQQWQEKFRWRLPGGLINSKGSLEENLEGEIEEELGGAAVFEFSWC